MTFSDKAQETISKEGKTYQSIKVEYAGQEGEADELVAPLSVSNTSFKKKLVGLLVAGLACSALVLSLFNSSDSPSGEKMTAGLVKTWGEKGDVPIIVQANEQEVMTPLMGMSSCVDVPNWKDRFDDGCDWYEPRFPPGCPRIRRSWTGAMGPATEGCCYCGGGVVTTPSPSPAPNASFQCPDDEKPFTITLINTGTNRNFDASFEKAKKRWESIVKCGLQDIGPVQFDRFANELPQAYSGPVDDLVIGYVFRPIDGFSRVLGFAGRTQARNTGSSISGIMVFDEADFSRLSEEDAEAVITHEMGHVLGLVNIEGTQCEIPCVSTFNQGDTTPYIPTNPGCSKAVEEYENLGLSSPLLLGNRCGHWAERSFQHPTTDELMTPIFDENRFQPISRVSVAALDEAASDYIVDYGAADPFPFVEDPNSILPVIRTTSTFNIDADVDEDGRRRLYITN